MKEQWSHLSGRERGLILIAGGLAIVLLLSALVISPLLSWRSEQHLRAENAAALYEMVVEAASRGGQAAAPSDITTPPRNAITQTAGPAGVTLIYVNTRADGRIDANIASTDPDALYRWIDILRRDYGITIDTADIARESGNPEQVRAQLTLTASGRA